MNQFDPHGYFHSLITISLFTGIIILTRRRLALSTRHRKGEFTVHSITRNKTMPRALNSLTKDNDDAKIQVPEYLVPICETIPSRDPVNAHGPIDLLQGAFR